MPPAFFSKSASQTFKCIRAMSVCISIIFNYIFFAKFVCLRKKQMSKKANK